MNEFIIFVDQAIVFAVGHQQCSNTIPHVVEWCVERFGESHTRALLLPWNLLLVDEVISAIGLRKSGVNRMLICTDLSEIGSESFARRPMNQVIGCFIEELIRLSRFITPGIERDHVLAVKELHVG